MEDTRIQIPKELLSPAQTMHAEGSFDPDALECASGILGFDEPLVWEADLTNTRKAILISGRIKGIGTIACSRCLEDAHVPIDGQIEAYYLLSEDSPLPDDIESDETCILPSDHRIEMRPHLEEAIRLGFEPYPVCSTDCKGLCPKCGKNLNHGSCGCETDEGGANNPFAALKDLF